MASPSRQIVLVGAGGHALEVAQLIDDVNAASPAPVWSLLGCLVEEGWTSCGTALREGLPPLLGGLDWLQEHSDLAVILAIGNPQARQRLAASLPVSCFSPLLVHPRAWVASRACVGPGTVVFAAAAVNAGARIGAHAILNLGSTVSHDCAVGDFTNLGPGCHLAGGVEVGEACDLGAGCVARPRSRVGARGVVGAGAVIVSDLPPDTVSWGVPAVAGRE